MVELVAEFTTNHMGHMGLLLRMVKAAKQAGADTIKMQKKHVKSFYTPEKLNSPYSSPFGKTYRDYRTMFELDDGDWHRFSAECRYADIPWYATAQTADSMAFLRGNSVRRRIKVSSTNAHKPEVLRQIAAETPVSWEVVLSVAGCTLPEIEQVIAIFEEHKKLWILHCVAVYPCPDLYLRLENIPTLKRLFGSDRIRIGYSGHEMGIKSSIMAAQLGAEMVERHFCLSRHSFVHHIDCSLEPAEFRALADAVHSDDLAIVELEAKDVPEADFGMSDAEKPFLVDQAYGTQYLGTSSTFDPRLRRT